MSTYSILESHVAAESLAVIIHRADILVPGANRPFTTTLAKESDTGCKLLLGYDDGSYVKFIGTVYASRLLLGPGLF